MSEVAKQEERDLDHDTEGLSRDQVFDVLGHERRRCVIQFLNDNASEVELDELIDHVAAWENDKRLGELTGAERKRVRTALQQSHLPKMEDAGLVVRDADAGTIAATESFSTLNVYLQVVGGRLPYSLIYLSISSLSVAVILGLWLQLPFLTVLPGVAWGALVVALFGFTSILHLLHTSRLELVPNSRADIGDRDTSD